MVGSVSTGTTDTGSPSSGVAGERVELVGGEVLTVQVVAEYDQSVWWDAADERWLALFDPALAAEWPDDRRLRFVRASDVVAREAAQVDGPTWEQHLRDLGVAWEQSPLEARSHVIRGNDGYHLEEDGFGDFAWDLVQTDDTGVRYQGFGASNTDFRVWGEPVVASVGGEVVEVVRGAPDNAPGGYAPGAVNNLVGVRVSGQLYAYYLHFQQGSIPAGLAVGATVAQGDLLGLVGNSGVTLEPHLHLTLHYWDSEHGRYWSVPSQWQGLFVAPAPTGPTTEHDWAVPQTGEWVSSTDFGVP